MEVNSSATYPNSLNQQLPVPPPNEPYQQWQPPPPNSPVQKYDTINVPITAMTVDQWNSIQNDKTAYSHLWAKDNFTPENFSKIQEENKCTDLFWAIAWIINLVVFVVVVIVIATNSGFLDWIIDLVEDTSDFRNQQGSSLIDKLKQTTIYKEFMSYLSGAIGFPILITLVCGVLHLLYMAFLFSIMYMYI